MGCIDKVSRVPVIKMNFNFNLQLETLRRHAKRLYCQTTKEFLRLQNQLAGGQIPPAEMDDTNARIKALQDTADDFRYVLRGFMLPAAIASLDHHLSIWTEVNACPDPDCQICLMILT